MTNLDSILKSRDITLPTKVHIVKAIDGFSSSHLWMWELDYKESWVPKNWCFWTVVLEKTLESPLHCKESQPVHLKGNQSSIFIQYSLEGLMLKLKLHLIWRTDSFEKTDAGKDWRWEKGMTEDEMVGWHHWCNGQEFEYVLGDGDGQGSLACCSPWAGQEADMAEQLNWTEYAVTDMCVYVPGLPIRTSLGAQKVKNLPARHKRQIWSLGWKDPLEKGMATHSSILA